MIELLFDLAEALHDLLELLLDAVDLVDQTGDLDLEILDFLLLTHVSISGSALSGSLYKFN